MNRFKNNTNNELETKLKVVTAEYFKTKKEEYLIDIEQISEELLKRLK